MERKDPMVAQDDQIDLNSILTESRARVFTILLNNTFLFGFVFWAPCDKINNTLELICFKRFYF